MIALPLKVGKGWTLSYVILPKVRAFSVAIHVPNCRADNRKFECIVCCHWFTVVVAGNMRRSEVVAAMKGRGGRGGGGARIRMQETDVDPSIERRRQEEKDEEDKRARVQAAVRAAMQAQGISVASTPVESDSNSRDGNGSVGDSNSPGDDPDRSEDGDDNDVSEGMSVPLLASVPAPRLSIPSKPPGAPSSRLVSDKPDVSPVISSRLPEASLPRAIPIPLASPVTSSSAGFAPTGPPVARPPPRAIPIRPPPRPQVIPQTPVVTPEIVEPVMQRRPSNGSATKSPAHDDAFATRRASGSQDFNHHQPHPPEDAHAARRPSFSLVDTGTVDVLKSRRQSITIPHAALLSPTAPTAPIPPILSQQPRHHKSSNSISESDTVTSMSSTSTRGTEKSSCNCAHCSAPGLHLPVPYSLLREQVRCNEFTLRRCTAIEVGGWFVFATLLAAAHLIFCASDETVTRRIHPSIRGKHGYVSEAVALATGAASQENQAVSSQSCCVECVFSLSSLGIVSYPILLFKLCCCFLGAIVVSRLTRMQSDTILTWRSVSSSTLHFVHAHATIGAVGVSGAN